MASVTLRQRDESELVAATVDALQRGLEVHWLHHRGLAGRNRALLVVPSYITRAKSMSWSSAGEHHVIWWTEGARPQSRSFAFTPRQRDLSPGVVVAFPGGGEEPFVVEG